MIDAEVRDKEKVAMKSIWDDERPQSSLCDARIEGLAVGGYDCVVGRWWPGGGEGREENF